MNTTATPTAAEAAAARETLIAKYRQDRRESIYEGKVWFTKERDKYGRTCRMVKTCIDGELSTIAAVVCVPRWTPELKAKGITRYFSNDWRIKGGHPTENGALVNADTLKAALARFGCGTKEYELYPA